MENANQENGMLEKIAWLIDALWGRYKMMRKMKKL